MSYDVVIFGIKMTLSPVAFSIPLGSRHWDIYWYGVIIATGFLLALIYGMKNAKRFGLNTDRMLDVILVATPVAILSARTYYVIFDGQPLSGIGDFFGFGDSSGFAGLAIYGGVIGAFASGAVMCKIRKVNILDMFDVAALGFLIGQGIGRWGNFVNQEAYGGFTGSSWWGMESTKTIAEMGEGLVHPCFLYESIWCLTGFLILHHFSKKRRYSGQIVLLYGVWYGFGRTLIELLRTDSLMLGNLRVSCLLSALLCLISAVLLVVLNRRFAALTENAAYHSILEEDPDSAASGETEHPESDELAQNDTENEDLQNDETEPETEMQKDE